MDDRTRRTPPRGDDPGATGPLWPLPDDETSDAFAGAPGADDVTRRAGAGGRAAGDEAERRAAFEAFGEGDDESTSMLSPAAARAAGFESDYGVDPTRVAPAAGRDWLDEPLPEAPPPRVRAGRPRARRGPAWPRMAAPIVFLVAILCVFTLTLRSGVLHHGAGSSKSGGAKATATHKPSARSKSKYRIYVVKSGDTMSAIAVKFHTTVDEILTLNPQASATTMNPGDRLRVPRQ
ncbi:MAG TPA: LysM domain-containing protein [Thermoleophilia bacterium]|nr:LysM domain-containing protein [Thermoleophilia bacterium]